MAHPSLVQLETFARVARLGSYTRAAEELHLTQPGVTQQVRALERHFGLRLVDIVGRRPVLTDAGRFLAERTAALLESLGELEREMGQFAAVHGGELRLGATLTIGSYVVPALLGRFAESYPTIRLRVEIANTALMARRIQSEELGLALIEGPLDDSTLDIVPFMDDRLCLVVPAGHRFARRARIAPGELVGEPFVWREAGSGTRAAAEAALLAAGIQPPVVLELPSGEGVARAVEEGLGLTILSWLVVERAVAEGRLATVDLVGIDLRRTFRLVTVRGRTLSPAARAFASVARARYPAGGAAPNGSGGS